VWSTSFGDDVEDTLQGMAVDSAGAIVLVGLATESIDLGAGGMMADDKDMFAAKLDAAAGFAGSMIIGSQTLTSVDIDDIAVFSLDSNGQVGLAGQYSGLSSQRPRHMSLDSQSSALILGGLFWGGLDFGNSSLQTGTQQNDRQNFVARIMP
jgi:hypothetical protein